MKKVLVFLMLLLSTSMAMAQFGSLKELKENEKQGSGNSNSASENPTIPGQNDQINSVGDAQLIEKCITNGFFLIQQDYQLEDKKVPGSRYNWGDDPSFGFGISFLVRLNDGFITSSNIVTPWREDDKFPQYENTHNPILSKTSTLKLGQKDWKTESKVFQPKMERELDNGLLYVKDHEWTEGGFVRATDYGKKDVFVVWLVPDESEINAKSIRFYTEQMELKVEKSQSSLDMNVPTNPSIKQAIGGIVLEPVYKGIGHIDLALVGVINNNEEQPDDGDDVPKKWYFSITILDADMGESKDTNVSNGAGSLTPTE